MPQITIREFDESKLSSTEYANFSVVVPGFVSSSVTVNKFDEEGVYEVSSTKDFANYIGFVKPESVPATPAKDAVAPELEELDSDGTTYGGITVSQFINYFNNDYHLYNREATSGTKGKLDDGTNYKYVELTEDELNDLTFKTNENEGTSVSVIKEGNEGSNYEEAKAAEVAHYGNQIAYELLKAGYTVLYKKLDTLDDLLKESFWAALKDRSVYDFRYIITGLKENDKDYSYNDESVNLMERVNTRIAALAQFKADSNYSDMADHGGRGDCVALLDLPEGTDGIYNNAKTQAAALKAVINEVNKNYIGSEIDKYSAIFTPAVKYDMAKSDRVITIDDIDYDYVNQEFPGSVHYLLCAANTRSRGNAEWYAVAGYQYGYCAYDILSTTVKFGEAAVNTLQPRYLTSEGIKKAVNVTTLIRGTYYLWGNRTAYDVQSEDVDLKASHFLNIRQLCSTIKKQTYISCKKLTFSPNSDILWLQFQDALTPTLEKMKNDQGVYDYKFEKQVVAQKAKLRAKIRIVPIEALEDFDIGLHLEDSISGTIDAVFED